MLSASATPSDNDHSSSSAAPAATISDSDLTTASRSTSSAPDGKNGASGPAAPSTSPLTPTPTTATAKKRVSFPPPSSSPSSSANPTPCTTPITSAFLLAAAAASSDEPPNLSSSRPAPPSPVLSRRTSMARSESRRNSAQIRSEGDSRRGSPRSSRVLSSGVGTAGAAGASPSARHRLSRSISAAEVELEGEGSFADALSQPSPQTASTSASAAGAETTKKSPITIRDFAYPPSDVRYAGLGADVPTPCDPARLARRLRGIARLSDYASPVSTRDDDDDDEGGWSNGGFMWGRGRMAFGGGNTSPSLTRDDGVGAADFARNFGDPNDDEYEEGAAEYVEDEEGEGEVELYYAEAYANPNVPLTPGLYRAQFPFEAIDASEMNLQEGQLIYVLGSGGTSPSGDGGEGENNSGSGAGWAIARVRDPPLVLDAGVLQVNKMVGARTDAGAVWGEMWAAAAAAASTNATPTMDPTPTERRALVPDSYIVLVRGEGEREADAYERLMGYLDWVEGERLKQEQDDTVMTAAPATTAAPASASPGDTSPDPSEEGEYEDAQAGDERGELIQA
ncbi:hypothetical protein B0H12DRAFT_1072308 [Mycena haematopus]|nr:hypothetical protein B0H12DRAFT_1072308 [Mycena haematopus]